MPTWSTLACRSGLCSFPLGSLVQARQLLGHLRLCCSSRWTLSATDPAALISHDWESTDSPARTVASPTSSKKLTPSTPYRTYSSGSASTPTSWMGKPSMMFRPGRWMNHYVKKKRPAAAAVYPTMAALFSDFSNCNTVNSSVVMLGTHMQSI